MNEERLPISTVLEMIRTRQITAEAGFELIKKLRNDKPSDIGLRESHERHSLKSGETDPGSPPRYTANHTTASGDSRPRCESQDVAVIGISGQFPDAKNVNEFWANLAAGRDSVRTVPESRWNTGMLLDHALPESGIRAGLLPEIESFDPAFFGISPLEAELMDPRQRLFLQEAWNALEDAGYSDKDLREEKCGVFVGCQEGDYIHMLGGDANAYASMGNSSSILAARISYFLDLRGPCMAIDTACSSSLVAVYLACESICSGVSKLAIAGGVAVMTTPSTHIGLIKTGMLSPDGKCRTFDDDADGFVLGEGVGAVILKSLKMALRDRDHIYGVIKGIEVNYDGRTNGISAPNGPSQTALECEVYDKYQIHPDTIGYVEAHGTGTSLGDPIEIHALGNAFRKYTYQKQYCPVGSVKTNIGHTTAAAGIASLLKVLLCLKHKKLVPSLNFSKENEHIDFKESPFYVNTSLSEWKTLDSEPRRAAISSFGFSGTNVHMVVEEPPMSESEPSDGFRPSYLVALSAKTEAALDRKIEDLANWLELEGAAHSIADIAYTLHMGRSHFSARCALVVRDVDELKEKIGAICESGSTEGYLINNLKETSSKPEPALQELGRRLIQELREPQTIAEDEYAERLLALADLYVKGYELDWERVYREEECRRISLPTYPFAQDRYWAPGSCKGQYAEEAKLHPLVDEVDAKLSLNGGVVFRKTLRDTDPILKDHMVNGQTILPGVGYLEMACAAVRQIEDGEGFSLSRVFWLQPVVVAETGKEVQIDIKSENGRFQYEIQSSDGEVTVTHSRGEVHSDSGSSERTAERISIEDIETRCTRFVDREAIYARFKEAGIAMGPYLQGLSQIRVNDNDEEALGYLALPSEYERELNRYTLHPTLMDGALQTIAGLAAGDDTTSPRLMMPFAVENVEVLHPLKARGYSYAKAAAGNNLFNVAILDETGLVCIKLHDVAMRELKDPLEGFFYMPRWIPSPLSPDQRGLDEGTKENRTDKRTILMIYPEESMELERALVEAHAGDEIVEIKLGTETLRDSEGIWGIKADDPAALDAHVRQLRNIDCIYFLGGIQTQRTDIDDLDALEHSQERGVLSLFRLIKSLSHHGFAEDHIQLKVITNDVHQVMSEDITNPYAASLLGLAKSMTKEYPHSDISCIDITLNGVEKRLSEEERQDLVRSILAEPGHKVGEMVAIRDGKRYVRTLESIVLPPASEMPLKHKGVYLILGGAGGIGLELGRYLAETVQARVILIGRSELNVAQKERMSLIESEGGEVLYLQADATDLESMNTAVEKARSHFGPINGVVHSAMVLRDKILENMDEDSFKAALAPKVRGSVVLHKVTAEEPLDFMMFFSAGQSFSANAGQSNYAAGCTFEDGFALCLNQREPYPVKLINWGYWGSVGVAATEEYRKKFSAQGIKSIEPKEGMEAVSRILGNPVDQIMPLKADDYVLKAIGIDLRRHIPGPESAESVAAERGRDGEEAPKESIVEADESKGSPDGLSTPKDSEPAAPPRELEPIEDLYERTRGYVKTVFSEVLKTQKSEIDSRATFDTYGVDSLAGMQIVQRLEQDFGDLPATLLFKYLTVEDLTKYFVKRHRETLETKLQLEETQIVRNVDTIFGGESERIEEPSTETDSGVPLNLRTEQDSASQQEYTPRESRDSPDIAIIGVSGRYPMSETLDKYWENLASGKNCISEVPRDRWDWNSHYDPAPIDIGDSYTKWGGFIDNVDKFDPLFFNISPTEAEVLDPQGRLFLETAWAVLEDAGYTPRGLAGEDRKVGVFVGVMNPSYEFLAAQALSKGVDTAAHSAFWSAANRVSYCFDFQGPSLAIDTACSSSLTAIHLACESIRRGECKAAIAGGVNLILHPVQQSRLCMINLLSRDEKCKAFAEGADGFVDSEGVGAVVLKPLDRAISDGDHIYAVIKGSSINSGGRTSGFTVPNPNAQATLILEVLQSSKIDPRTISYLEAHGTGTSLGDPIEILGLAESFEEHTSDRQYCAIGSVKSNIGHAESAAGIAALTKVLLQMKHKQLVPSIHSEPLNPNISFEDSPFYVQQELSEWKQPVTREDGIEKRYPRRAGVSSFGAGGANAHVVLEEYEKPIAQTTGEILDGPQLIVLSARNEERLRGCAKNLVDFLGKADSTGPTQEADEGNVRRNLRKDLLRMASDILGIREGEVYSYDDMVEYGFDEVSFFEFANRINEKYNLETSLATFSEYPSVASLARYLASEYRDSLVQYYHDGLNDRSEEDGGEIRLADIAYTLQVGREAMEERLAVTVSNVEQLKDKLIQYCDGKTDIENLYRGNAKTARARDGFLIEGREGEEFLRAIVEDRKITKLAQLWVSGVEIDWRLIYPIHTPNRVSLPTYPFARERHWIQEVPEQQNAETETPRHAARRELEDHPERFFYAPRWAPRPLPQAPSAESAETAQGTETGKRSILIIYPSGVLGLEKALAQAHAKDGAIEIKMGSHTRQHSEKTWEVSIKDSTALDDYIAQLETIDAIYFLGGIQSQVLNVDDLDALEESQERGVLSLFRLIKSLTKHGFAQKPLQLKVITNDVHQILPGMTAKPYSASLHGLAKSTAKECWQWDVSCVDISLEGIEANPSQEKLQTLLEPILAEPAQKLGEDVAVRNGTRYVRAIEPIALPQVTETPFKQEGVYLILGGAGGVGLELGRYLAETVRARLVLLGRSELDARQQDEISAIEATGGQALYLRANATNMDSMKEAILQAKSRFGKIDGVIHSAMVSRDGTLDNMDEEAFRAALAPKVTGSVILRKVTQQEPLDFMMFFSSFASFSGNAGASNYVAGCAFEDAFAEHLDHSEPYPVRVINWGYWGNVGSGAREDINERFTALGLQHIKPEEGMEAVRRVLGNRESQIMALKAEEHLLKLLGIDLEHRIELRPESIPSLIETIAHQDYPFLELDEADMDKATAAFKRFSQCLLLDTFRRMEVFVEGGERYEKDQLRERLRIAPEYHRLYEALLDILVRAGFVELEGQVIVTSQQLGDGELQRELEGLEEKRGQLLSIYPEMEAYVKVVWACLSNYPAILRGEIAATDVLFPGGSMELVEGLYKGDIVQDHFNSLAVQSIRSYVQARRSSSKNNEKIKIIEVGAGTGGTSAPVLEAISEYGEQVHYLYTDISVAFTRYGKAEYADSYPFVEFKVLNLERDVEEQGYAPGDFDVVLAANVLHATKRLRDTLRNVKALLKTNGWLVINEATEVQDFATMAFGLLDGWWLFEDEENRMKYSPLLSQSMWQRLLKEEGFERVASLGTCTTRGQEAPCDVLIAESNGEVRRRTQASHRDERGLRTSRSDDTQTKSYKEVSESRSGYSAVVAFLVDMFARLLGVAEEELDIHADVAEYGLDSIMASKAFMVMQGEYGDALTAQDMMSYSTIDSLASFIAEHAKVAGGAEAPSHNEYKTNTGQSTGPIMQIPDAELAAAQDRSSTIAEVCGLTVLAFFQKMGLFRRAEDRESVDGLQTTLHVHPDGMPLLNTLLYILVEQGVLHVDGETICLSEHGQSAEMQSRLGGLESRIELIQRAVPELSPHFALLKHCADHYQQILEGQISPESVFASEQVQSWIAELYKRDNWGPDQAYPWFLQYFAQSFARANLVQGNKLRILECGDILSNLGRALLESLPPNAEEVECYYLDGPTAHGELKAEIYNATYPKVSFKAIENTDELTISGNGPNNFDVIVLHTDLSDTTKLRRQLGELKNVARPDGLVAAGNPVELEFLRLTFGLVDKRWLYESELSSGNDNSSWISVFEDLGFHVQKVVGDWLVVASQEAQSGAIKNVDLAATSAAVQTKDIVSLPPKGGPEDGESPVSTEVESYYGVNRRSFEVRSGRQYEVVSCGHGEPIIFLTGLSFTWRIWEFQTAALSGQYQLVFPHLPGHEGSRFNGEPFTFESLTDDLADVMDQCNLSSGHLVGWCMSGNIAQLFALRHPEKLRSLVLIGTTPGDARTRGLNTEDVIDYAHDPIDTYELEFRNIFKEFSFKANFTDQYLTFLRQTSCRVEVGPVLYYLDSLFRFDSTTFLQEIRVPTLVMAGKWDIAFPVDQIELLHRGIPNSIFFEFGKSGHLPFLTQHDLFNHQLTSFLHEIETRKGNPESGMAV